MRVEAHAKINWALAVEGRRADGYHELDMVTQTIALCDEMTLEVAEGEISLRVDGQCAGAENLVYRAAEALHRLSGGARGARIELHKRIPERAGLGGGSADCAAALRGLNAMWNLRLADRDLLRIGLALGADVPFCLTGGLCRVRGVGERVERLNDARALPLLLLRVGDGLATADVFKKWDEARGPSPPISVGEMQAAVLAGDFSRLSPGPYNALEAPARALLPEIGRIKERMRSLGAAYAAMSGSGSTVFGAFHDLEAARRAQAALPGAILTETLR